MQRLTFDGNFCDIAQCVEVCEGMICEDEECSQKQTWERLKLIEDILGDEYDLDRLRELVQADYEGRCVVLPCKIGDTVYQIEYDGEIVERRVLGFFLGQYGVSYVFHVEGFGEYRTDPGEKVYLTRESAENALKKVRKWEK